MPTPVQLGGPRKAPKPADLGQAAEKTLIEAVERGPADGFERTRPEGKPAVFLDRDGVINRTDGFINHPDDVDPKLIPEALEAIAKLTRHGVPVIILTNQGGIERGYMTEQTAEAINERFAQRIEDAGGHVRAIYFCPRMSAPDLAAGEVDARKPSPGMFFRAASEFGDVDLSRSAMVGDQTTDLKAADEAQAGITKVLVRTGFAGRDGKAPDAKPDRTSKNLLTAVDWLLSAKGPLRASTAHALEASALSPAVVKAATDFVNAKSGQGLRHWEDIDPYDDAYFPQFGEGNCGVAAGLVTGEAAQATLEMAKQSYPRKFEGVSFDPAKEALLVVADSEDEVSLHVSKVNADTGAIEPVGAFNSVDGNPPAELQSKGIWDAYDYLKSLYGGAVVLKTNETDRGVDLFDR